MTKENFVQGRLNFDQPAAKPKYAPGIIKNVEAYMEEHGIDDFAAAFSAMKEEETLPPYQDQTGT